MVINKYIISININKHKSLNQCASSESNGNQYYYAISKNRNEYNLNIDWVRILWIFWGLLMLRCLKANIFSKKYENYFTKNSKILLLKNSKNVIKSSNQTCVTSTQPKHNKIPTHVSNFYNLTQNLHIVLISLIEFYLNSRPSKQQQRII